MQRKLALFSLLAIAHGCHLPPSRLEPYREWVGYCRDMAARKQDPVEGIQCIEEAERRLDAAWKGGTSSGKEKR